MTKVKNLLEPGYRKRLNAGFRLLVGATVFEMLRNERLAHAQIALRAETVGVMQEAIFAFSFSGMSVEVAIRRLKTLSDGEMA